MDAIQLQEKYTALSPYSALDGYDYPIIQNKDALTDLRRQLQDEANEFFTMLEEYGIYSPELQRGCYMFHITFNHDGHKKIVQAFAKALTLAKLQVNDYYTLAEIKELLASDDKDSLLTDASAILNEMSGNDQNIATVAISFLLDFYFYDPEADTSGDDIAMQQAGSSFSEPSMAPESEPESEPEPEPEIEPEPESKPQPSAKPAKKPTPEKKAAKKPSTQKKAAKKKTAKKAVKKKTVAKKKTVKKPVKKKAVKKAIKKKAVKKKAIKKKALKGAAKKKVVKKKAVKKKAAKKPVKKKTVKKATKKKPVKKKAAKKPLKKKAVKKKAVKKKTAKKKR